MNKILIFIYLFCCPALLNAQNVDFTFKSVNGLYCNPTSIQFTQFSSGSPSGFAWNFGDGSYSNDPDPAKTYKSPGSYLVKLIVIYEQFAREVSKTITINASITASIGYDRNNICKPGIINFKAASNGNIASYYWDFGDGTGTASTTANYITHNFSGIGTYTVTLKAVDVSGCFAITTTSVTVKNFSVTGTVSPVNGCVPANITFNANAIIPVNSSITNYTWDFKDGNVVSTSGPGSTNHTYNVAGNYNAVVAITTSDGCINKYTFDSIAFGTPPTNPVAYTPRKTICGSESAVLISRATKANSYCWNFADEDTAAVRDTVIQYKFKTLGIKNVTVIPLNNNCKGAPATVQINVIGVISNFDYYNSCSDKKTFTFINSSQGNLSTISWNFGDGSPVAHTSNATHTYPSSGAFVTSLSVTDNVTGCSDVFTQSIYTANAVLKDPDTAICRNSNTSFSITNNYSNPAAAYEWNVLGNKVGSVNPRLTSKGVVFGYFNNSVIINNGRQYCPDTIPLNHKILVRGPIVNFTAPDTICFNHAYNVTNTSRPYIPTDYINIWSWDFGSMGTSNKDQPLPYQFTSTGMSNVRLAAADKNGCTDSIVKTVMIKESPFIRAIPGTDTLCAGKSITMIAFHNDPIVWSPANLLSCTNCDTIVASPQVSTKFYVTATNILNCSSTDTISVKVYEPFTAVPGGADPYICTNDKTTLNMTPSGKKIIWSPASQMTDATLYSPIVSPLITTVYTATLSDSAGCFTSKADVNVHVKTLPIVNAGADKTYSYNANFSFSPTYSNNVAQYYWSPATNLNCSNCAIATGIARVTTKYVVHVISDSGCVAKDSVNIFVSCNDANILVPNAFTPNGDNLNDYFYPTTHGIRTINKFSIYNRLGKLVYEGQHLPPNDRHFGWNGKVQNTDQSTAVFVYFIEATCDVGEKIYAKGSVVLLR